MKNKNLLNLVGREKSYEQTRKSRNSLDSIVTRFSLVSLICLCMLTLGVGNVWGAEKEWDFSTDGLSSKTPITLTYGIGEASNNTTVSSGTLRLYAKRSNGKGSWIKFEAASGYEITAVSVTATDNQSYARYAVDPASMTGAFSNSFTFVSGTATVSSLHATSFAIRNGQSSGSSNKTVYFSNITITYASTASCSSEITITKGSNPANGTFTIDNSGAVCIDEGNASTTVTATPSSHYHLATVTSTGGGSVGVISNNTCTVSNISANTTINVTFAADPTYTVTWVAGSNPSFSTQTNYAGTALTDPGTPSAASYCPGGKVFVGWTATPIVGEGSAPADLFTSVSGKSIPSGGTTYYAVFATQSGGGSVFDHYEKVTTAPDDWTAHKYVYATADAGYVLTGKGSGNYGAYTTMSTTTEMASYEITVENGSTDNYKLKQGGKYISCSSFGNLYWNDSYTAKTSSVNNGDWMFYKPSGTAYRIESPVKNSNNKWIYIDFNSSADPKRFNSYVSGNQTAVYLYKRVETSGYTYSAYATTCADCTENPTVGVAALKGSFNASGVGVTCPTTGTSAGSSCSWQDYGFIWSTSKSAVGTLVLNADGTAPSGVTKVPVGSSGNTNTFDGTIAPSPFNAGTYYYRAYGKNNYASGSYQYSSSVSNFVARSVTFNLKGHGSSTPTTQIVKDGAKATNPGDPSASGWRFDGWYDNESFTGSAWNFGSNTVTSNITLYAKWTQVYTVTYVYGTGGSGSCANGSYAAGETVTTCSSATKTASTLTGWLRSDNSATITPGNTFTMPSTNVTLTAVWEDTPYTLTQTVGANTTKGYTASTIKSGDTPLDLTYSISAANKALPKTVTISGGRASWTLGTDYTWTLSSDKHSATLHINATVISSNMTVTVTEQTRYTITWNEHGSLSYSYFAADDNSLDWGDIDGCGEKEFYGWTADAGFVSHATTPPTMIAKGSTVSASATYYAIYGDRIGSGSYSKVTTVAEGETYLIACPSRGKVYVGQHGSDNYGDDASVTISTDAIASKGTAHEVRIEGSASKFAIYDIDAEKYIFGPSYSDAGCSWSAGPTESSTTNHWWNIGTGDYVGEIQGKNQTDRYFAYNYNGSSHRFAAYKTPGSNNTGKVYFYKYSPGFNNFSKTCTLYDITITTPSGGTVTTTPAAGTGVAGEGQTVTVNVTPNSCKYLSALKYNDGSDHAISIASTPYTFTMPAADVTVTATFDNKTVSSITPNTSTHRMLMEGTSFVGEEIRVTYNNGETENLTWDDSKLAFSGYNMSSLGNQTVTVTYTGCGSTTTTYSITITDGIPVTFSDCGNTTLRKYDPGDVVPVETTSGAYACSGWEFVGWSATAVANNSTSFTPVRNFNASTARTLYAVYAHQGDNFISAKLTSELHTGARYVLAYYVNNNTTSYGLTGLLPTTKNTNYLQGTHTGNSGIAYTETNVGGLYQYTLTSYTPVSGVLWQLQADGTGYWQLYNISQRKYLNLSSYSDGYVSVSTSPVGKLVLEDEDANPAYCNGSRVYVKYNGGTKRLAWNRNSGDGYWNQHTSGYQFFLTKDEYFSSTPPCAPRSVTFHGNGGTVIAKTGTPTGADLEITEASRDAGIYLPTAETDAEDCDGKVWSFIGWIDHEVDLTRVPILTTDLLNDGYDPLDPNPHYDIIADDEEYWAVYTNTGDPETKYGTISFTKVDFDQQYSSDEKTITKTVSEVGDYTFGYKRVGHQSSIGIQFENGTGEFYNKTSLGKVTSISFTTFNVGAITNLKVYVGDEEKSTTNELTASDLQVVGSTYTYYPRQNCGYVYIKDYNAYVNIGTITVNFGQGTEVWATTPDCSILSLSGTVRVTSTSGKKVKAVTPITVSGHGLAANAAVSFAAYNVSDDTPNSHFTFIGSASADINGDVSSTNIVVAYQPTETSNGTEEVYFKASASNGSGTTESGKLTGYGRHLPAKFVIATKVSGNWYALPNNVTTASYGTRDLIPITVDNTTTPTTATVYTSTTDYLAWNLDVAGTGTGRYSNMGEYLFFSSPINSNRDLAGDAVGLRNSAVASTSSGYEAFAWKPATTDFGNYTLQNGSATTYYVATNGSDKWNTATTGADVRFLIYDEQPAPDITWYNDMLDADHATNKAENGVVTLPTGADPVSCNATLLPTFCGWKDGAIATYVTSAPTYVQAGDAATTDKKYYAVFKHATLDRWYTDCPTIYTITYTANGGTGADHLEYTMNTTADAITVGAAGFSKEGCTFVGWTNPDDVDGTIITPGTGKITGLTGDITLNAVWIGTTTVTGTVRLTASAGEKVATSGTEVTISSTDFACATALRITYKDVTNDVTYGRSGTPNYTSSEFRLCNGSYGAADLSNISLAEVSGAYNQTFSMTYEPNGGANTLDEYQLKVEVLLKNTVIDTKTLSLYGRTLPESFAIAIKIGGSWYALPNNMGSSGTYDPILISVTEDASVLNWAAQGPSTVAYKMKDYTTNYSKLRFAADDATEYCLWAATGNAAGIRNYSASSTDANYAWTVAETNADFSGYTMANLANTRTGLKIYDSKWQMYSSGGLSEIHFIPLTTVTPIDVTVMEWGVDEIAVKTVANWTPSAITAQISGGSPSAVTKTSIGGDLYKLTGVGDLQGNPGEPLALNVTDGGAKQAIIQIPFIVTDTKTEADLATILKDAGYAATLTEARSLTKNMDVIVRSGGTLSSESSTSGTFQNVYIYPGGKADFTKNISIQNIYMRGGFSWLGGAYAHPQMNVASTASISGIGSTGHGIFYDLYLDNSIYYVFALPKDVAVTTITNEENGDDWDAWIKSYSGEGRTLSPKVSGWSYVTSGSIARGAGYEIAIKPRLNRPYGILRFPLLKSTAWSAETDCTPSVKGWGANNANVSDNNKGWNFIGNPFLTAYNNSTTPGSTPSGLIQTQTLVPSSVVPWDGKYVWSSSNVKYFTIPRYTEYEYDDVRAYPYKLDAFFPFFIQATGDGTLSFDDANRALKAPTRYVEETQREVIVDFILQNASGKQDLAGLTICDNYSADFDMNDKEKTIQNGNSVMKVYTMVGEYRTAFNSLPEAAAAQPIPVGYIAPAAGNYSFSLQGGDFSQVEHVWLTDYTESSTVDLLNGIPYQFETAAGTFNERFALNVILRSQQETPTGTGQMEAESDQPQKFIYQEKMYIMRGGVIYDATGKKVCEINK